MMKLLRVVVLILLMGCQHTNELRAPCTYDDRKGCGEML
jgi:hypothetical protein